jgi:hypothetical protein
MTITINDNDKTTNPLLLHDGSSSTVFDKVIVTDTAPLASTETVTITGPEGGGTFDPTKETFTESGPGRGSPTFATDLLHRLIYHAPTLPNGQAFAFQAGITVTNGAVTATDSYVASGIATPVVIADVAPPAIAGTVANEPIARSNRERQRAYRDRLKAAGKVLRVINADALTAADALRVELELRQQDVARLTARNHYLENELRHVKQYNLNILKEVIVLRQTAESKRSGKAGQLP